MTLLARLSPLRRPRLAAAALAAAVGAAGLAGCGGSASGGSDPALRVVVSAFPLVQLVKDVGGSHVQVDDLAPDGVLPQDLSLSSAGRSEIASAAVVIDIGDGFQPQVEAAAAKSAHHLSLVPAVGTSAYQFWLDPKLMTKAAGLVAATLSQADPAAAASFQAGVRDLQSSDSSIDVDIRNNLSDCAHKTIVTADDAFAVFASEYGLVDVAVNPARDPVRTPLAPLSQMKTVAAVVRQQQVKEVLSEPFEPAGLVEEVAALTNVQVHPIDPFQTISPGQDPLTTTYFNRMLTIETTLVSALSCESIGSGP
jgi:ABC-type Zn uptake system ZnuABC Zn-binding protein ZnuA